MTQRKKKTKKKVANLDELENFSSGKIEDESIRKTKELEEVMGLKTMNHFGTNDPDVFEQKLSDCNLADLQRLCQKVGVFPSHDKSRLKEQLRQTFKRTTKGSRSIVLQQEIDIMHPDHPDHEKAKRILTDGF
ncbi:hypothetical protein OAH07_03120 [Verrucomicrobia bacterium]|nr:hypothetical protein [bacterium]MDB4744378.1 hypothetical protein [Verrucomicrobiota bacterium]MDB4795604.1 hypothetical protein [Verrucomicrobiota bacterium]MDC0317996.1 hypothetical protein [bacterium]